MKGSLYQKGDANRASPIADDERLEPEDYRSGWRRDYARVIHCPAFRRLQGKMQLFPSHESDFYRNRLTHSLEVTQIAKSVAIRLNNTHAYFRDNRIQTDIVELAALTHDIGHPPFGHNGEQALDELMGKHGGFEGNAQTLRILSRIEKKQTLEFPVSSGIARPVVGGRDIRCGLNLTSRCLASVLKYDNIIPKTRNESEVEKGPVKGYYYTESDIVERIKYDVVPEFKGMFKSIECSIMDIADDIAYSTYDLEDSLKAGFVSLLDIIAADDTFKEEICRKIKAKIDKSYGELPATDRRFGVDDFNSCVLNLFGRVFELDDGTLARLDGEHSVEEVGAILVGRSFRTSGELATDGYLRTELTSTLVGQFVRGIEITQNAAAPDASNIMSSRPDGPQQKFTICSGFLSRASI